ncbi:beta carbonic anhydrase 5, chloroplastic-like isoform X2 [Mercurialis annua]|uniref:beta carbonic anhydrase 5, chloroplastic-like isoform X2 n=1 Tax=Mercurialis annua TaxID=3986 RepID=UPI00215F1951|nr:beta carbonic anhydrase 5, chloroplastic-like isoform X2 [Mercurialis annua]
MILLNRSRTTPRFLTTTLAYVSLKNQCCHGILPFSTISNFPLNFPSSSSEKLVKVNDRESGLISFPKNRAAVRLDASISSLGHVQQLTSEELVQNQTKSEGGVDLFDEMKKRFLNFKKHTYLTGAFQKSCRGSISKDSRVCPSNVLGFEPGEAFMIRNVANIVPPIENGPTETNAALEFAVNTLEVENIFVIGHSNCAGIQALMSMPDDNNSSFVEKWVATAKVVKLIAKTDARGLSFDQQCQHCEKESINHSLLNLLTYPWIEERVRKNMVSIHGGYYDFSNCSFEKWTLDFNSLRQGHKLSVKDVELWG